MTRRQAQTLAVGSLAALAVAIASRPAQAAPRPKMPAVLERIGRCETRMTWSWSQPDYATAFGIHRAAWHDYRRNVPGAPARPEDATPEQQVAVALSIARKVGWTAWGCFRKYAWVRG